VQARTFEWPTPATCCPPHSELLHSSNKTSWRALAEFFSSFLPDQRRGEGAFGTDKELNLHEYSSVLTAFDPPLHAVPNKVLPPDESSGPSDPTLSWSKI